MKRIICVDDDAALRNVFSLIFARAGYDIEVCPDGEAIMNNEIHVPDIYILDKQLSGYSGLDICLFLKSQPETPFRLKDILEMVESYTANRIFNE